MSNTILQPRALHQLNGYSLLELITNTAISSILFAMLFYFGTNVYTIVQQLQVKVDAQNAKLFAYFYLAKDVRMSFANYLKTCKARDYSCAALVPSHIIDLINDKSIKPLSDLLILKHETSYILYYLKKSCILKNKKQNLYALYRHDLAHNAVALVEGILDFKLEIVHSGTLRFIKFVLEFQTFSKLEAILVPRQNNKV